MIKSDKIIRGKVLFVAGNNLSARLRNHPAQRLPYGLAPYVEQMDLIGYVNFYGGPPASRLTKICKGVQNILYDRLSVTYEANIRKIITRRLPLPLSMAELQCKWIYQVLSKQLSRVYDVGIIGHPENAHLARILKESGRVRYLIYNDWDYYPGFVEPEQRNRIMAYEQDLMNLADGVASVSRPLQKLRRDQGAKNTSFITNGVDFEMFHRANVDRKPHPPTLIYCGSVDARWGIDLAIRAMPIMRQQIPNLRVIIVGNGPAEDELKALAKRVGVGEAVLFSGSIPYQQLPAIMAKADIGLATSPENEFRKYASPMKIMEYMAAGLPVVVSGGGEAEQLISESRGGVHIDFTTEALTQAVLQMLQDHGRYKILQAAALDYAHSRTWHHMGQKLAQFMEFIIRNGNREREIRD